MAPVQESFETPSMATCRGRCLVYLKNLAALLLSPVGLAVTTVVYAVFGGFLFSALEAPHEKQTNFGIRSALNETIMKLWKRTLDFNILDEEAWCSEAEEILESYTVTVVISVKESGWGGSWAEDAKHKWQWTFGGALLFSVTAITTIGFGSIAPKTLQGRSITIVYAIIGKFITHLSIAHLSKFLTVVFRFIYKNIVAIPRALSRRLLRRRVDGGLKPIRSDVNTKEGDMEMEQVKIEADQLPSKSNEEDDSVVSTSVPDGSVIVNSDTPEPIDVHRNYARGRQEKALLTKEVEITRALCNDDNQHVRIPTYVSLALIGGYIILGSMMFGFWEEKWNFWIGTYFCTVALLKIGFGDVVPGTAMEYNSWEATPRLVACAAYLLVGLAVLAMCIDLIQEDIKQAFRSLDRVDDPKPLHSEKGQKMQKPETSENGKG